MAYKRRRSYRRKKRAFTKKEAAAIVRIAQKPVETKDYPAYQSIAAWLAAADYNSSLGNANQARILANVYSDIPRNDNLVTREEHEFGGTSIQSRGLRWSLNSFFYSATPGNLLDVQFRFTVFSMAPFTFGVSGPAENDAIFDLEQDTTATFATMNPQVVKIHFQRKWRLNNDGNVNGVSIKKFYIPLRRKIQATTDSSLTTNNYMGEIKGMQVYWLLEMFAPGLTAIDLAGYVQGSISTKIYFKDA